MILKSLDDVLNIAKSKPARRIAVAAAEDEHALAAVRDALSHGIIAPVFTGNTEKIRAIAGDIGLDIKGIEIIDEKDPVKASAVAVSLAREGKVQILMKGLVGTADYLKCILDRDNGIGTGVTMSHVTLLQSPAYHKLLCITDCGMIVLPTFKEKVDLVRNALSVYKRLKADPPKVAVLAAVEVVNDKMDATVHAAMLAAMNRRGQIKDCIIDGPFAFDNLISKEACEYKGIKTEVGGDTDIILCPNLETGNTLYKALTYLGGANTAGIVLGAKVPVVLTSRTDSDKNKLMSIALAAAME